MEQAEKIIECQCREWARQQGWVAWKNEKNGCKGIPDDSFLSPDGSRFILVEFKKDPKQRLREEQKVWLARFPEVVFVVSSLAQFKEILGEK